MAVPFLSRKCPCRGETDEVAEAEPCGFIECQKDSYARLTLSGIDSFGWETYFPYVTEDDPENPGDQITYHPRKLADIDGTLTLKLYNSDTASELEKRIMSRINSLRTTSGGCHYFAGMPETLRFHSYRTNPDAPEHVTAQYTSIAMFPVAGYILGGDINNTAGRVNELAVQIGCIVMQDTREPFPHSSISVADYLALREKIRNTDVKNLPGWAARRAEEIQIPVMPPMPVIRSGGGDVLAICGVPGGSSSFDGRYTSVLYVSPDMAGLTASHEGELIFSTTYDYGASKRPCCMPDEPFDPFQYGHWEKENPQQENESNEDYAARRKAAQTAFSEIYLRYLEEKEAFLEELRQWTEANNTSVNDWSDHLVYDQSGNLQSGTFSGIYFDGCAPKSGSKPEVYPRRGHYSLELSGCISQGEMPEPEMQPAVPSESPYPVPWKVNGVPVYGNQYGGAWEEYPPYIAELIPDEPDPDEPEEPDEPQRWYIGFKCQWAITYFHYVVYAGEGDNPAISEEEYREIVRWPESVFVDAFCDSEPGTESDGGTYRPYGDGSVSTDKNPVIGPVPEYAGTFFNSRNEALAFIKSNFQYLDLQQYSYTMCRDKDSGVSYTAESAGEQPISCNVYELTTLCETFGYEFTGEVNADSGTYAQGYRYQYPYYESGVFLGYTTYYYNACDEYFQQDE